MHIDDWTIWAIPEGILAAGMGSMWGSHTASHHSEKLGAFHWEHVSSEGPQAHLWLSWHPVQSGGTTDRISRMFWLVLLVAAAAACQHYSHIAYDTEAVPLTLSAQSFCMTHTPGVKVRGSTHLL
jgi:hypothetical protein